MGNVPAAVAEGARRATGATAAFAATDRPPPVLILSLLAGRTRSLSPDPGSAWPYTLAGVHRSRLVCRRWLNVVAGIRSG
jgi:hypothetical protein